MLATTIVLVCLAALALARFRDPRYPPFLHAILWLSIVLLHAASRPAIIALPAQVYVVIGVGAVAFAVGSFATTYGLSVAPPVAGAARERPNRSITNALVIVLAIGLFPLYLRARTLAADGPTGNFLIDLRLALSGDIYSGAEAVGNYGMLQYLVPLSVVVVGLEYLATDPRDGRGRWWYYASLVLALAYAVLATGRTYLFTLLLLVGGIGVASGRTSLRRTAALFVGGGMVLFLAMAVVLNKAGGGTVAGALGQVQMYLLGGTAALGRHLQAPTTFQWGANVFRTPLAVMRAFGLPVPVVDLIKDYQFVPDPTNVYTFFLPYYDDFGFLGVVVGSCAVGMLHGAVYVRAAAGRARWVLAYALLLYPLFMQFFQDQYLTLLSMWLQYAFWAAVGFHTVRRTRSVPVEATA